MSERGQWGQGYIYIARKSSSSATCPLSNNPLAPNPATLWLAWQGRLPALIIGGWKRWAAQENQRMGLHCLPCTWLLLTTPLPTAYPPLSSLFTLSAPRHPFPFLLPGEAKGAGAGCTLTCLDTTVCFCSVAKARGSTFATLEMQVKSQRHGTGDVFRWERKERSSKWPQCPTPFFFF